jgi:ankyrin repeat protein
MEIPIIIALAGIFLAVLIPGLTGGKGVLVSLLTAAGWVAAIVGGFLGLAFIAELPGIISDWRTTPATVRAARGKNALKALERMKPGQLDARATDRFGNNALHGALDCYQDDRMRAAPAVVELLLRHGPDVNAVNHYDKTPLDLAVERGHGLDVVRRLLAAGAAVGGSLHAAAGKAGNGAVEIVEALLAAGTPAGGTNALGATPLHEAASYGTVAVIRVLLAKGADIGARDRDGKTPLHSALWMPSLNPAATAERVAVLVAAGADRDAPDNQGRTPRELAARSGAEAVIAAMGR